MMDTPYVVVPKQMATQMVIVNSIDHNYLWSSSNSCTQIFNSVHFPMPHHLLQYSCQWSAFEQIRCNVRQSADDPPPPLLSTFRAL